MKIILANTVGVDSDGWSIIAYPSRWTTASMGHDEAQVYYPRDLGYLSSLLKRDTPHEVRLIDGCLDRYNKEEYARAIVDISPDWLVMENSTRTFDEDRWIAEKVKRDTGAKVMMTGQHVTAFPEEGLAFADLVIRGEYLKPALRFFQSGADYRGVIQFDPSSLIDVATLPFPEDGDVSRYDYALRADNICEHRQIQVYATRGCPYGCSYCVARHAYFGGATWRARPVENVVAELAYLAEKYPDLEGFFFDDEIHNARISYLKNLARAIKVAGLDVYKFEAMLAYAPFDEESMELIKEAGYYKVRVGIETASEKVAESMGLKGKHRPDKLEWFLTKAKELDLKVYGTFTVGGRGASAEEDDKTIRLMARLIENDLISDCQISITTPQPGAPFYNWAAKEGLLQTLDWHRFDGGEEAVISLPGYSSVEIKQTRRIALQAYDEARRKRDAALFESNARKLASSVDFMPGRVLVFRSSRDWNLELCLKAILNTWDCEVVFLCHEGLAENYKAEFPSIHVIPYRHDGFLSWGMLDEETLKTITSKPADLAMIPSNTRHCRGYGNVLEIAEKSGASAVFYINSTGELIRVGGHGVSGLPHR